MGFMTGFATGLVGGMADIQDNNRRQRDEARRDAFKYYRETVLPKFEANREKAAKVAANAKRFGALTGSADFHDYIIENELTDPKAIYDSMQMFDMKKSTPAPQTTPTALGADPSAPAGPAATLPPAGGLGTPLAGAKTPIPGAPAPTGGLAGGMAGTPPTPTPTPTLPSAPAPQAPVAPDAEAIMAGKSDSKVPGRGLMDTILGKPDYSRIRGEAIDQLAVEQGLDRGEMQKRLTTDPMRDLRSTVKGDGSGMTLKAPLDPISNALIANTLANMDRFSDPAAVRAAIGQFQKDRDSEKLTQALSGVGFLNRQAELDFQRSTSLAVAGARTHTQKLQEQALDALAKAGSLDALRQSNPGAAAVLEYGMWARATGSNPINNGMGGNPYLPGTGTGLAPPAGQVAPPAPSGGIPAPPPGLPAGSVYSPSRKQWRDPSGKIYDPSGKPVK